MNQYLLVEQASGYALFKKTEGEEIAQDSEVIQAAVSKYESFKDMVSLVSFQKFESAEEALSEILAIGCGDVTPTLENFLELNLPKAKKKSTYQLGVWDSELGKKLNEKFTVNHGQAVKELLRGCLLHFPRYIKEVSEEDFQKARCGLAHSYSRAKMQLDPNRQDKPIMNTIAILDNLDKNINTFAMRVKEWYAWHFPEMTKIVNDNIVYAKLCRLIRIRDNFDHETREAEVTELTGSEEITKEIIAAMKISMGQDIVEMDMANIDNFAMQVVELANMRTMLGEYLKKKMDIVAPNLASLIGEHVGARLISHAGSLTSLAKYPASTVQILGAEKALFRALKTKGNTPKYGLLYHSTFIGRAQAKNKGRISRYLANKCSIASRIDCFTDQGTKVYGESMKQQVEDRLSFLTEGVKPRKNVDVMREALEAHEAELASAPVKKEKKEKKSKKAAVVETPAAAPVAVEEPKKEKKDKKKKRDAEAGEEPVAKKAKTEEAAPVEKKKKKEKKNKA